MLTTSPPPEFQTAVRDSAPDFLVQSSHVAPFATRLGNILLGFFLGIGGGGAAYQMVSQYMTSRTIRVSINGVPRELGPDQWITVFAFGVIPVGVICAALFIFIRGIRNFNKPGDWYAIAKKHMIQWNPKQQKIHDWSTFTGTMAVTGDNASGSIDFTLTTGKMVNRKNRSPHFVPDHLYLLDVKRATDIAAYCKQQIDHAQETKTEPPPATPGIFS